MRELKAAVTVVYPNELREKTRLEEKTYPLQLFVNERPGARMHDNILFLHWHEHFEIIMMRRGRAIFHIDSEPYEASEGDVLFVPAGGLHVGYSLCDSPVSFVSIVFNGSLFNDWVHDPVHTQYVAPYLEGQLHLPVRPDGPEAAETAYRSILDDMLAEFTAKRPAYQLILKTQLYLCFTLLARANLPTQNEQKRSDRYSLGRERFKPLFEHLDRHFAEKMSIEQAARFVNLTPYHFCKTFKRLTGRTFIEYVNVCRINEAERLLLGSDRTITEIAGRVGCDNPNYFTKLFKQYKGVTPSRLRKRQ